MYAAEDDAPRTRIAVIGGGWAGCAAAVTLAQAGQNVTLLESSRILGGRARAVQLDGKTLDNGQHILLGAYRDTLAMMEKVGIDTDEVLLRLPLQMRYPVDSGGMDFIAPRLPAPWHVLVALLRARGLSRADKHALARFSTTARWMEWRMDEDCSVSELLERFDQTPRLTALMWRPLCLAALNTPPERASAQVFLNVLRDSLGAKRAASDMLLPRVDLSELFPRHAARFIQQHQGAVYTGTQLKSLCREGNRWWLEITGDDLDAVQAFDKVVLATPPWQTAALLEGQTDTRQLQSFSYEPITTCYLRYSSKLRLPAPFLALIDDPATGAWGQFVFDRGQLNAEHAGMLAVVVSSSSEATSHDQQSLCDAIAKQLATALNLPQLAEPRWSKVISEKRATFSCTPGLIRPGNVTNLPGIVIAGDYTAGDYPATLEAAVRSGMEAARLINQG
ncbi:MAG TPA: hydroxysqualene dehydroxylase HpnE [Burkholderiaceae bacterium]